MKFEMEFGWIQPESIVITTNDFEKIEIIKTFIEFQDLHGWAVDYVATEPDDEDFEDEDTEEEEIPPFALDSKEEL
jgi:hypothetical protein